jgi:hypothetical protein
MNTLDTLVKQPTWLDFHIPRPMLVNGQRDRRVSCHSRSGSCCETPPTAHNTPNKRTVGSGTFTTRNERDVGGGSDNEAASLREANSNEGETVEIKWAGRQGCAKLVTPCAGDALARETTIEEGAQVRR